MAKKRKKKSKSRKQTQSRAPLIVIGLIVVAVLILFLATRKRGGTEDGGQEDGGQEKEPLRAVESGNMLENPGFEDGEAKWEWLSWSKGWAPFEISTGRRRSGSKALFLPVRSAGEIRRTIVWGVMQKVILGYTFPECLEGWYLVSDWQRGAKKQYLQTVIISDLKTERGADQQIRMMITGMDEPSYNLTNARYFFCDEQRPLTPPLETWVRFRCQPRKWFKEAWDKLPPAGTSLRVFFESRFDDRQPSDTEVVADTYFDDVYLGPATDGHCQ
jgi:hypothetical protein